MKKFINRNFLWADFFVKRLETLGVKYVCISPGSRSTPLTTAFSQSKKIKKFVIVDERSSAFFALGLAKQTGKPTAIVTTSGTATANLYPAIIEAYQSRIPMIVCTADRPAYLRNTGANQTINQDNLYANHIRFFYHTGLPELKFNSFKTFNKKINEAYLISIIKNRGPVHFNFPFEKPLEESIKKDKVNEKFLIRLNQLHYSITPLLHNSGSDKITINTLPIKISETEKGLIFIGWDNYTNNFAKEVLALSKKFKYPLLVDGASGLNFGKVDKNIICNHNAFLRSEKFLQKYSPEIIIQFGSSPTSNPMLKFLEDSKAYKILVNEFGDNRDPSRSFHKIIKADPVQFCCELKSSVKTNKENNFLNEYRKVEETVEKNKNNELTKSNIEIESALIIEAVKSLPNNSNLFISNSLPVRDVDYFKSPTNKNIKVFVNRGTSGIDGINSTAAGVAAASGKPTLLITGDLAFFHDTTGLHILKKYSIPLTILLINNGGGAIFGMLPVAEEKDNFVDNFLTPLNLDFSKLVKSFSKNYSLIKNRISLRKELSLSYGRKTCTVLEVKTDYKNSIKFRKDYFRKVMRSIDDEYAE